MRWFKSKKNNQAFDDVGIVSNIEKQLDERKTEKHGLELQWRLNANFLIGNQYCEINAHRMNIESQEPFDQEEKKIYNRIAPLMQTREANLSKLKFSMACKNKTNEIDDYMKAEVSTQVLRNFQEKHNFESKNNTALSYAELTGTVFKLVWWDNQLGEEYITDPKTNKTYYTGDVNYCLLTSYEVFPESLYKDSIEEQGNIIVEQVMTVEEIKDIYNFDAEPEEITTFALTPIASGGGLGIESTVNSLETKTIKGCKKVVTYFEKRSKRNPGGNVTIIIDKKIVWYGDLPYKTIPIVMIKSQNVPGQFFGKSVIQDMIPLQRQYNSCVNKIHEFIRRIDIDNILAEEGSVDIDDYLENGHRTGYVLEYSQGSEPPTPVQHNQLPQEVLNERIKLERDLEYVAGVSQLMVIGATPSGVTSGKAMETLQEIDNTRLALTGTNIRESLKMFGKLVLNIYKQFSTKDRILHITGSNALGKSIVWCNENISDYDIEFTTENELLYSEEYQEQQFMKLFNMGLLNLQDPRTRYEIKKNIKRNGFTEINDIDELDIQDAQNENVLFESGSIPEITPFDNHDIHYSEHLRYIKQMKFKVLKQRNPQLAKALEEHTLLHKQQNEQELAQKQLQMQQENGG